VGVGKRPYKRPLATTQPMTPRTIFIAVAAFVAIARIAAVLVLSMAFYWLMNRSGFARSAETQIGQHSQWVKPFSPKASHRQVPWQQFCR
jgi:hypothetical protein